MILGQLSGGAIGDALGRHLAMTIMMSLQIISSLGSACSFGLYTLQILSVWRFLLGIGAGGVYPVSFNKFNRITINLKILFAFLVSSYANSRIHERTKPKRKASSINIQHARSGLFIRSTFWIFSNCSIGG